VNNVIAASDVALQNTVYRVIKTVGNLAVRQPRPRAE